MQRHKNQESNLLQGDGNINFPQISGALTISFIISLQLLQTPEQAISFFSDANQMPQLSLVHVQKL